jgi:DNA repair protein RecN (Recombination protein N)
MLRELSISNFALITDLRLSLGDGFTVLTGETGAGKSIIIDALSALLGEPAGAEDIRAGERRARVEGVFDVSAREDLQAALEEAGVEAEEGLLLLARRIEEGRSYYYAGGHAATRGLVRELGERLVDIHGQHQHQTLIHEQTHLDFLDAFGGTRSTPPLPKGEGAGAEAPVRAAWDAAWGEFQRLQQELARLRAAERDRAQRIDLLAFQVQELEEAALDTERDTALPGEHRRLANAERLRETVEEVLQSLEGEWGEGRGAAESTAAATIALRAAAKLDESLLPLTEELTTAETVLREVGRSLRDYAAGLDSDPRHLARAEERLALLERLRRKYGETMEEIIAYQARAAEELAELQSLDSRRAEVEAEVEAARATAGQAAETLSAARRKQARALEKAMVKEVRRLGMEQGRFAVELEREPDPEGLPLSDGKRYAATARGIDRVRFLLSANAGEPLRPLSAVASGGELSRLMLAFRSVCAPATAVSTLIFDEIDVGIGGVTAHAVAEKLAQVAASAQVLCVTHLPQIASLADHQIHVSKAVRDGRTVITARELSEEERVAELARMMGAREGQEKALRHAEEMLTKAREGREALRGE